MNCTITLSDNGKYLQSAFEDGIIEIINPANRLTGMDNGEVYLFNIGSILLNCVKSYIYIFTKENKKIQVIISSDESKLIIQNGEEIYGYSVGYDQTKNLTPPINKIWWLL